MEEHAAGAREEAQPATTGEDTAAGAREGEEAPGQDEVSGQAAAAAKPEHPAAAIMRGARTPKFAVPPEAEDDSLFPTSPLIERQISFWIKIFTEYPSNSGLIHDKDFTLPIYASVNLEGRSRRQQRRYLKQRKRQIARDLKALARGMGSGEALSGEGAELLSRLPRGVTPREVRKYAQGVRFQRGLADRFRRGLVRSGAVLEGIQRILVDRGVPRDLAYLPHVESSYNLRGYSKFGAAGIWQFTRGTGRRFLTIKYELDERLDPLRSTEAAASFLRQNYDRLGSWPLAITAYNHGPQGIERIVKRKGTRDLSRLIEVCGCRRFKFASKNFYAEFLAARMVAKRHQVYFGDLELDPVLEFEEVHLPFYLEFAKALQILGIEEEHLSKLNPALRTPVILGAKYIPKGYYLRIPPRTDPERFVSMVPSEDRRKKQKLTEVVRVRRGDTLYGLGRRYGVPWQVIARANNITAYHRIRPGQRLVLPRRAGARTGRAASAVAKAERPAPARKVAASIASLSKRPEPPLTVRMKADGSGIAFQRAEGAYLFQNFDIHEYDAERGTGIIEAAYGETLGHYAEWAGVSTVTIRRHNRRGGSLLRPGRRVAIPLSQVTMESFSQSRFEYHQSREEDFYSTYAIAEVARVKVRRGDSVWHIAQSNNVPMWLFYRQNPRLVNAPVRAGMVVELPVIEELAELERSRPAGPGPPVQ